MGTRGYERIFEEMSVHGFMQSFEPGGINPFEPTRFPPKFAPGTAIFQGFNLFVPRHEEFLISAW